MDGQLSFSGKLFIFLTFIGLPYILMTLVDVEEKLIADDNAEVTYDRPLLSLGFCSICFASLTFFASFHPDWIGANPISLLWIISFAVIWSFSFSFGQIGLLPNFGVLLLFKESQYLTDRRGHWEKLFWPEPQSAALSIICGTVFVLVIFGAILSAKAMSSIEINRRWRLLLGSSLSGIALGCAAYLGFWLFQLISV
jgi:hypothetical protein